MKLISLGGAMLTTVALVAPLLVWPMTGAQGRRVGLVGDGINDAPDGRDTSRGWLTHGPQTVTPTMYSGTLSGLGYRPALIIRANQRVP
jgi:hypothetical protein